MREQHNIKTGRLGQTVLHLLPWAALLLVLVGLAAVHGLAANYDISYEIMNGDFQNYNPVRRLLAGQRPYEDFAVYLGAGELYSVGALLLVLGNSFGRSILVTNFCTWFFFELLILAACLVVLGKARPAGALTAVLSGYFLLVVQGKPLPFAGSLAPLLEYAARNGTSARMIRAAALPLAVLLLAVLLRWWQRRQQQGKSMPHPAVLVPLVSGALVVWSNDMGAALYLAISLAYGMFLLRVYGTRLRAVVPAVLRYIGVSVASLGISILLISRGHPLAWLRQTRGVGSYQAWYYGTSPDGKLYALSDLRPDWSVWVCLILAIAFAVGIWRCRSDRSAALAGGGFALCFGMVLWNVLYCVLSAAEEGPEGGPRALLAALVPALAVRGAGELVKRLPLLTDRVKAVAARWVPSAALAVAAGMLVAVAVPQVQQRLGGHEGLTYVPTLGGWIGDQAEKLATEEAMLAGRSVWSSYASALEAMTGQFQPSGTDYIIHVMGDAQRSRYLQQFQTGTFDWVETPSPKVAPPERWSRNANWWFYRELYRSWEPVNTTFACGGMHLFWQRTGADNDLHQPVTVNAEPQADGTVLLTATAQDPTFCGVADVHLTYEMDGGNLFARRFLHATMLTENELCAARDRATGAGDFFLPTDRGEYDIPMTIADGVGQVLLTPCPNGDLTVRDATVTATYFDWEYFFE